MEHVVVRFSEERGVYMDGNHIGTTGDTLMVEEGHHVFDLGTPPNYTPSSQEVTVTGTDPINPQVVSFQSQGN